MNNYENDPIIYLDFYDTRYDCSEGNDLSTPRPEFNFPGLTEGDAWCLCSMRWLEAYQHASAPKLYLRRTHQEALSVIDLDILQNFALDLN